VTDEPVSLRRKVWARGSNAGWVSQLE